MFVGATSACFFSRGDSTCFLFVFLLSTSFSFPLISVQGVPIRVELGPKDLANHQYVAVRRDTGEKLTLPDTKLEHDAKDILDDIQRFLYERAKTALDAHLKVLEDWDQFCNALENKCLIKVGKDGAVSGGRSSAIGES